MTDGFRVASCDGSRDNVHCTSKGLVRLWPVTPECRMVEAFLMVLTRGMVTGMGIPSLPISPGESHVHVACGRPPDSKEQEDFVPGLHGYGECSIPRVLLPRHRQYLGPPPFRPN